MIFRCRLYSYQSFISCMFTVVFGIFDLCISDSNEPVYEISNNVAFRQV